MNQIIFERSFVRNTQFLFEMPEVRCFHCNQYGHLQKDCPQLRGRCTSFGVGSSQRTKFATVVAVLVTLLRSVRPRLLFRETCTGKSITVTTNGPESFILGSTFPRARGTNSVNRFRLGRWCVTTAERSVTWQRTADFRPREYVHSALDPERSLMPSVRTKLKRSPLRQLPIASSGSFRRCF